MTFSIRDSRPDDGDRVLEIWNEAVDAAHDFLAPDDRVAIGVEVAAFLPSAALTLVVDEGDNAVAFMLVAGGKMEALFVDPSVHASGAGRTLVQHALESNPGLLTDVNEQNTAAIGFYEHLGFRPIGRSELDGEGRPYPLIHLQHSE